MHFVLIFMVKLFSPLSIIVDVFDTEAVRNKVLTAGL